MFLFTSPSLTHILQSCGWNGWTVSSENNGDIESQCSAWGVPYGPQAAAVKSAVAAEYKTVEPGAAVQGVEISGAAAVFMAGGAVLMKKRGMRRSAHGDKLTEMTSSDAV